MYNTPLAIENIEALNKLIAFSGSNPKISQKPRKRYSRLSESLVRTYLLSHLRDIRIGGRETADKMINKLILSKNQEISPKMLEFIIKNRSAWVEFIYKISASLDIDALVGFFVPFIYGGIVSRKNPAGEIFGILNIEQNGADLSQSGRFSAILSAIEDLRRRGASVIVVVGNDGDVYAPQMLSVYQASKNESFVIIEKETAQRTASDGEYKREALIALSRSKNVFVIVGSDTNGESSRILARSRALSSYGILHGIFSDNIDKNEALALKKGSAMAVFGRKNDLSEVVSELLSLVTNGAAVDPLADGFFSHPSLPIALCEPLELMCAIQYVNSGGKMSKIIAKNV